MANPGTRKPVVDGWYSVSFEHGDTEMLWTLGRWWAVANTGCESLMFQSDNPLSWDYIKGSKWLSRVELEG